MSRILAPQVADYSSLIRAVRERVAELGITHETLDAISGLQSGYASKLLADPPIRRIGPLTLFIVLQSLGMSLSLVEDRKWMERAETRLVPRKTPRMLRGGSTTFTPDYYSRISRDGNEARMIKLTPARRKAIARNAARARWAKAAARADSNPAAGR
jgi:hypothetical protein